MQIIIWHVIQQSYGPTYSDWVDTRWRSETLGGLQEKFTELIKEENDIGFGAGAGVSLSLAKYRVVKETLTREVVLV